MRQGVKALLASLASLGIAALASSWLAGCGWCGGDEPEPRRLRPQAAAPAAGTGTAAAPEPAADYSPGGVKLPDDLSPEVLRYIGLLVSHRPAAVEGLIQLDVDAAPAMEALLASDNIAELRGALEFMARTGRAEHGARIVELTNHAAAEVRVEALRSLITLELREHANAVTTLLKDDNAAVRALAIEALATLGSAKSARALVAQLDDDDVRMTVEAALALGRIADAEIAPLLAERIGGGRPATQIGAMVAARRIGLKIAAEPILAALGSKDEHVTQEALKLVALAEEPARTQSFVAHFDDARPGVRRVAIETYATFAPREEVVARATKALAEDRDHTVRAAALDALAQQTEAAATRAALLAQYVADASPDVRTTAYVHLGGAGAPAVEPLLSRLATEEHATSRRLLVRAIGEVKAEQAIEPLIKVLAKKKPKDAARTQAWLALRAITGKELPRKPERWQKWWAEKQGAAKP